jgi:nucleotide-binding universal stress UspA family protein
MIKTILTAATGSDSDGAVLAAALAVARLFGAHLDVLHVRLDATTIAMAMATDAGSGALTAGLIDRLEQDATERAAKAEANFTRFCGQAGLTVSGTPTADSGGAPSAEWHVESGEEPRWMATYGIAADLIVARRAHGDEVSERSTLEAILLETGRPLLIPAATAVPAGFERIAIAWKGTPQAARAVALAMPFLAHAREIVMLTVEEPPEPGVDNPDAAERLLRNLAWHGLAARSERLKPGPESAAATLLAAATGERADLLVMGGYGHGRVREWVFGGFTQQVLADAPLPVLIVH